MSSDRSKQFARYAYVYTCCSQVLLHTCRLRISHGCWFPAPLIACEQRLGPITYVFLFYDLCNPKLSNYVVLFARCILLGITQLINKYYWVVRSLCSSAWITDSWKSQPTANSSVARRTIACNCGARATVTDVPKVQSSTNMIHHPSLRERVSAQSHSIAMDVWCHQGPALLERGGVVPCLGLSTTPANDSKKRGQFRTTARADYSAERDMLHCCCRLRASLPWHVQAAAMNAL